MAVTIEWRFEPTEQHTGTAELLGVGGAPFVYVHPEDNSRSILLGTHNGLGSCAGSWYYTHVDTTESTFTGNVGTIVVNGSMSYANYHATRRLYKRLSWFTRFMLIGDYQNQEDPDEVFGYPLATGLQPSGHADYHAYIKFDPPPPQNIVYTVIANFETMAKGESHKGSKTKGSITGVASAFDHTNTPVGREISTASIQYPADIDIKNSTVTYPLNVAAGTTELHIGKISTGPAYVIRSGYSEFIGVSEIEFLVNDAQGNPIVSTPAIPDDGTSTTIEDQ